MFQAAIDKKILFRKFMDEYTKYADQSFAVVLQREGVTMNYYSLAVYLDIPLADTITLVKSLTKNEGLTPALPTVLPYYFRPDIGDLMPVIKKFLKKKYAKNLHVTHSGDLVNYFDISIYYGIKLHVIRKLMRQFEVKKIALKRNIGHLYALDDVLKFKDHPSFRQAVRVSTLSVSAEMTEKLKIRAISQRIYKPRDEVIPFRDMDCPIYLDCLDVAATTTNYMDCKKCLHWQKKTGVVTEEVFEPELVFLPLNNRSDALHIDDIKVFPNALA